MDFYGEGGRLQGRYFTGTIVVAIFRPALPESQEHNFQQGITNFFLGHSNDHDLNFVPID